MAKDIEVIKQHVESWKKQCGYDIPFDYHGLKTLLDANNTRNIKPKTL